MPVELSALIAAAFTAWLATVVLAGRALELGWVERRDGALADRKPRRAPIPPVGGAALLLGLLAGGLLGGGAVPWIAALAAFALGLVDDVRRGGLGPAAKLAGQALVGVVLALETGAWELAPAAVVAMNAVNTWDNADGAAGGLGAVALFPAAAAGASAGFLPWNLRRVARATPEGVAERVPHAYLGDSGSHLLGLLVAAEPRAWPALAAPLVDLARLALVRRGEGRPPWSGDRLHLAHRLQAAGLGSLSVAGILAALCGIPVWIGRALPSSWAWAPWVGASLGGLAVLALAARTPDPAAPCPRGDASR